MGAAMMLVCFGLVAGCGDSAEERGGVTAEEARELDNAAEMLDASPDSLDANAEVALDGDALSDPAADGAAPVAGDAILNNGALPPAQ
jgi:hypothetical protein